MPAELNHFSFQFKAMGTLCELQFFCASAGQAEKLSRDIIAEVLRLEAKYSRYREDSLLSEINRAAAAGGAVNVDAETALLLDYAQTCYLQSDGLFDISSGLLRRAWKFREQRLPGQAEIDDLLERIGWSKLEWRPPALRFLQPGMELDFGGVVKEYAVDRAANLCRAAGVRRALVNLGGDLCMVGPRGDGQPWIVGISHPRRPEDVLTNLAVTRGAVAYSGDYQRCMMIDGVRYAHVLNPKTGWPVRYLAGVAVIGDQCVVAGSATTIAMLKEREGPAWLRELGLPHIWMDEHGRIGGDL